MLPLLDNRQLTNPHLVHLRRVNPLQHQVLDNPVLEHLQQIKPQVFRLLEQVQLYNRLLGTPVNRKERKSAISWTTYSCTTGPW